MEPAQRGEQARRLRVSIGNEHAQREYFEATRGGTRRAAVPDPGADRDLRGPGGVRDVVNQHTASVANDRDRGEMFQSGLKKGGDKWLEHRGRRYADKTRPLPGATRIARISSG